MNFFFLGRFLFSFSFCPPERRRSLGRGEVSGALGPPEPLEELAFGRLHVASGFGVGLGLGKAIQLLQRDARPQPVLASRDSRNNSKGVAQRK